QPCNLFSERLQIPYIERRRLLRPVRRPPLARDGDGDTRRLPRNRSVGARVERSADLEQADTACTPGEIALDATQQPRHERAAEPALGRGEGEEQTHFAID